MGPLFWLVGRVTQNTIYCCGENEEFDGYSALGAKILSILLRKACEVGYQTFSQSRLVELIIPPEIKCCNSKSHFTPIGTLMLEATDLRDRANNLLDEANRLLHDRLHLPPLEDSPSDGPLITSIRASRWEGRLEASYHSSMAIKALRRLKRLKIPIATLGDPEVSKEVRAVTKFRKRVYVKRGGIPMYNSKQLFQVDPIDVKYLAKGAHTKDLPEIGLAENMITVSRSGTIGRVQIIPQYMKDWTANEHNDRLIAAPGMNAGYIYAWLDSDYGYCLVTRHSYGSVIQEIDLEMLKSVPIPMLDASERDEIGNLVFQGNGLRDQAWQKEQEAIRQFDSMVET
jgi:type I restriction enzyme S subunit